MPQDATRNVTLTKLRQGKSSHNNSNNNGEKKQKKIMTFVKFQGLGCKGTPLPAPSPSPILQSAAGDDNRRSRNQNLKMRKAVNKKSESAVVDFSDVCCAPPGIGIASDIAPRGYHRKTSREAMRIEANSPAISSGLEVSRTNHQFAREIIQVLMSQQPTLLSGRISLRQQQDRYHGWRLDVDAMSYEELLDLSDKIGYVGTGLEEEDIHRCLHKFRHSNSHSTSLLVADLKDWKCSICQEKCKRGDDIGTLNCGHHHHIQCIKQWLLQKNACPVCKSAVMPNMSN